MKRLLVIVLLLMIHYGVSFANSAISLDYFADKKPQSQDLWARGRLLTSGIDIDNGIKYRVMLDTEYLTMEYGFFGGMRLMQLVKNGFALYVNPDGGHKKKTGIVVEGLFQYELGRNVLRCNYDTVRIYDQGRYIKSAQGIVESFSLASWKMPDTTMYYSIKFMEASCRFSAFYQMDSKNNRFVVRIPIKKISDSGLLDTRRLTVGLYSKKTRIRVSRYELQQPDYYDLISGRLDDYVEGHQREYKDIRLWLRCR